MIKRKDILIEIASTLVENTKAVTCLGRISRDLFNSLKDEHKDNCFYCMGSMGSTLPFAMGIALTQKDTYFLAVEGDGSIIMNLGALLTFKRYNPKNLTLVIIDNKQYETTGGQKSQPDGFELVDLVSSTGLSTLLIENLDTLQKTLSHLNQEEYHYDVVIVKSEVDTVSPRINISPIQIKNNFKSSLTQ